MSEPYKRLDEAMTRRRLDLGMKTWRDLAQAAGIAYETLRALRKAEGGTAEGTVHGVERALQWQVGSIERILKGGSPLPIGALPSPTAEMAGSVTELADWEDEEDSAITPQLRALLKAAQQRTEERLAELTQQVAAQSQTMAEQTQKMSEQNEMLRKLLEDRKGA